MRALVIVDVQRDFLPGGALAVPDSGGLPRAIYTFAAPADYDLIVATQDWHPPATPHFRVWPVHCVVGTPGAELDPDVDLIAQAVYRKGYDGSDGYSGLDNPELAYALAWADERNYLTVDVCGLALDHCVRATALDARRAGHDVRVLSALTRAVLPANAGAVLEELRAAGVGVA